MDPHNEIRLFIIRIKSQWLFKAFISLLVVLLLNLIFKNHIQNDEIINKLNEYDPKKWTERFPSIWNIIKDFLTKFFNRILNSVRNWAINASNSISSFFTNIGNWFLNVGTWFVNFFYDIGKNLKNTAEDFGSWITTKSIEFVKIYVFGIFIFISYVLREFVVGFFSKVLTIPGSLVGGAVNSAFPNWAIDAINTASGGAFNKAVEGVVYYLNAPLQPIRDQLDAIEVMNFEDFESPASSTFTPNKSSFGQSVWTDFSSAIANTNISVNSFLGF
jgi:uncharacterized membrane protein YfcA